jgi:hypothetical protein
MPLRDDQKVQVLVKAYGALRTEILQRMKIAFSHLGYFGAIVAFVALYDKPEATYWWLASGVGLLIMLWISWINWRWFLNCAAHLRYIETQLDELSPGLLIWESRANRLATKVFLAPKPYEEVFGPTPGVSTAAPKPPLTGT